MPSSSKISLESMFPITKQTGNIGKGKIDMNILYKSSDSDMIQIDTDFLVENMKKIQRRTDDFYKKTMQTCWNEIKQRSLAGYTKLIFSVPYNTPIQNKDIINYKISECRLYIMSVLEKNKIKCKEMGDTGIYISWEDLE